MLCTVRSRRLRIDAAERLSGEGWSPSIDSTSVDRSVPSAVLCPLVTSDPEMQTSLIDSAEFTLYKTDYGF